MSRARSLVGGLLALVGAGMFGATPQVANATPDTDAERVARGFKIAPVPLNLAGLDRNLVGLGSYIVNAQGGCNDCHTNPPYAQGGDPFAGQKKKINAAGYLAGGVAFGPFISRQHHPRRQRPARRAHLGPVHRRDADRPRPR